MKQREWYVHRQMVSFMREAVGHVLQMLVCGHSCVWSSLTASDLLSRFLKLIQSCTWACISLLSMLKEGGCWLWERGFEDRNTPWAALCYLPVWEAAVPTSFKCPPTAARPKFLNRGHSFAVSVRWCVLHAFMRRLGQAETNRATMEASRKSTLFPPGDLVRITRLVRRELRPAVADADTGSNLLLNRAQEVGGRSQALVWSTVLGL